jgi:hypothetical protein
VTLKLRATRPVGQEQSRRSEASSSPDDPKHQALQHEISSRVATRMTLQRAFWTERLADAAASTERQPKLCK